jgi:hypothetical protein
MATNAGNGLSLGRWDFKVHYREVAAGVWRTTAEIRDDLHEIISVRDISVPERRVVAAELEFWKCPFEECKMATARAQELIGTPVKELGFKNYRTFLGRKGCPNAYLLFGLSGPALKDVYDLNLVAAGGSCRKMTPI